MKVRHIHLREFKRFDSLSIEVCNSLTDEIAEQFLILGDNGSGKTTVLQAVALCLSMAAGVTQSVDRFHWLGWVPGRYRRWGNPVVELQVHFLPEEIEATRRAARQWHRAFGKGPFVEPGDAPVVTLRLDGERCEADTAAAKYQFRGRFYARRLLNLDPAARDLFADLPGVFWFDQFRNLASPVPAPQSGSGENGREELGRDRQDDENGGRVAFDVGVARLREHLNRWRLAQLAGGPRPHDYLLEIEDHFKRIFPDRSFSAPEPMYRGGAPTPADYYFLISDGHRTYDIEEMSAGEQSVFPLLFEFVRQQIRNSVVLVDEIDLNLHPPLAQALLAALPALGPGCQFLLTTHSDAVSSVVSENEICRLAGGRLCL